MRGLDPAGQPPRASGGFEDQAEVQCLPGIRDVEQAVCGQVVDAVADRGQVGGVVAVATVALAEHERDGVAVRAGYLG